MGHSPSKSSLYSGSESPLAREFEFGARCHDTSETRDSVSPMDRRAALPRLSTTRTTRGSSRESGSRLTTHRRTQSATVPGRHSRPRHPPPPYSASAETSPLAPRNIDRPLPPHPPVTREAAPGMHREVGFNSSVLHAIHCRN